MRAHRSPALIEFVWTYIKDGTVDVTPEVDAIDAERALEFFGFPAIELKVPEDDPMHVGKLKQYQMHRKSMKAAPEINAYIKVSARKDERLFACGRVLVWVYV